MIPQYVQSNPSWSPDGKYMVFARARTYELRNKEAENDAAAERGGVRGVPAGGKAIPVRPLPDTLQ